MLGRIVVDARLFVVYTPAGFLYCSRLGKGLAVFPSGAKKLKQAKIPASRISGDF
jgi:hypothetical protein